MKNISTVRSPESTVQRKKTSYKRFYVCKQFGLGVSSGNLKFFSTTFPSFQLTNEKNKTKWKLAISPIYARGQVCKTNIKYVD